MILDSSVGLEHPSDLHSSLCRVYECRTNFYPKLLNITAPSQPPVQLKVIVLSSTSVQLAWRLPPNDGQNGIIRGFKVYHQRSSGRSLTKDYPGNSTLQCVLDGLEKFTLYNFKVLAYTILDGPYTRMVTATTAQDGMDIKNGYYNLLF
jgi:hypothetical protein